MRIGEDEIEKVPNLLPRNQEINNSAIFHQIFLFFFSVRFFTKSHKNIMFGIFIVVEKCENGDQKPLFRAFFKQKYHFCQRFCQICIFIVKINERWVILIKGAFA